MPAAARVDDPVAHTAALPEAKKGFWGGVIKGALIGAAIVAATVVVAAGVAAAVGTGGLGAPVALVAAGAAVTIVGSALRYGAVGFSEGAAAGAQQMVDAGQITRGSPNVFINQKKAAMACFSTVACLQHGPASLIAQGSQTVFINGHAAARQGDMGTCAFIIKSGSANVFIGAPPASCHGLAVGQEISDATWRWVNVAFYGGAAMELIGGLMMGGWIAGLRNMTSTTLGKVALGTSVLTGVFGGTLASEWAKSQGMSASDQMMYGDAGGFLGSLVGGMAVFHGGPPTLRGMQQAADGMDALAARLRGPELAFEGVPGMGGRGGSQSGWADQFLVRPSAPEPVQRPQVLRMDAPEGGAPTGGGTGSGNGSGTQRPLPANGQSIPERIAAGGEPPPAARQNPDDWYYDPATSRYVKRPPASNRPIPQNGESIEDRLRGGNSVPEYARNEPDEFYYDPDSGYRRRPGGDPPSPPSRRDMYMGATPTRDSPVGRQVTDRMRQDGLIRDTNTGTEVYHPETRRWYPIEETEMGHIDNAVDYWNREGYLTGPRSPEVRRFMQDPSNYRLEPGGYNRSQGAQLRRTYRDPAPGTGPPGPP